MRDLVPELLAPHGAFGRIAANAEQESDFRHGLAALERLGDFDIGQALVLSRGHIVAVEGAEGTDGLLERVAQMRQSGRISWTGKRGLLVKAPKAGQDLRIDLPAVGPRTVTLAAKANLAGIAVLAGHTLMIDVAEAAAIADGAGLFFQGFERPS